MVARLWTLLQGGPLLRQGMARLRAALRTECRRPVIIAAAAGLLALQLLPGGMPMQRVTLMSPGGWAERSFTLPIGDPRLESLRQFAAAAGKPNYAQRSDDYYRAQWDMETAQFYAVHSTRSTAADSSATPPNPRASVTPAAVMPATSAPSDAVTQVSFERVRGPMAAPDWAHFWETRRETSAARLRSLEPPPAIDPAFARLRFGELALGPLPISSVFASLCAAALAFMATRRWACHAAPRRIPLRSRQPLVVPPRWFRQRRSLRDVTAVLTPGRIAEGVAAATLAVASLFRFQ